MRRRGGETVVTLYLIAVVLVIMMWIMSIVGDLVEPASREERSAEELQEE